MVDLGSGNKIGELCIAAADALGMNSSPRHGGVNQREVFYELWPGVAVDGYKLQHA